MKISVLIVLGLLLTGCCGVSSSYTPVRASHKTHTIRYEILTSRGNGIANSITYENQGGDTTQLASKTLPWQTSFEAESSAFLYVSAQNEYDHGDIICRIYVDGTRVKETKSEGGYVIASCSTTAP